MSGLRSAIGFLTVFPTGSDPGLRGLASARGWFPAVGLLLGSVLAGTDLLLRWLLATPPGLDSPYPALLLSSTVIVVALVAMTRALHLDGLMDTCDALLGGTESKQRLRILKDPHAGAFAVAGATCLLLVKVAALSTLPWQSRPWVLILVPCLSRWAMLLAMELFPYVGGEGLGASFLQRRGRGQFAFGLAVTLGASVALAGPWGLVLVAFAALSAGATGAWSTRLMGGVTGDVYGAVNETAEATTLLLAVFLTARSPTALATPLLQLLSAP